MEDLFVSECHPSIDILLKPYALRLRVLTLCVLSRCTDRDINFTVPYREVGPYYFTFCDCGAASKIHANQEVNMRKVIKALWHEEPTAPEVQPNSATQECTAFGPPSAAPGLELLGGMRSAEMINPRFCPSTTAISVRCPSTSNPSPSLMCRVAAL